MGLGLGVVLAMEYFIAKGNKTKRKARNNNFNASHIGQQCKKYNIPQLGRFPKLCTVRCAAGKALSWFCDAPVLYFV